jgi:hypothetical protein
MGDSDSYYSCDDVSSETDNQCSGLFAAVDALDVVIGPDWAGTKRSNECDDGVDSSRIQQVGADVAVGGGKAPDELDSPTMEMWEDLRQYLVANYAKSAAKLAEMRSYDAVVSQSLGMTEMSTRLLDKSGENRDGEEIVAVPAVDEAVGDRSADADRKPNAWTGTTEMSARLLDKSGEDFGGEEIVAVPAVDEAVGDRFTDADRKPNAWTSTTEMSARLLDKSGEDFGGEEIVAVPAVDDFAFGVCYADVDSTSEGGRNSDVDEAVGDRSADADRKPKFGSQCMDSGAITFLSNYSVSSTIHAARTSTADQSPVGAEPMDAALFLETLIKSVGPDVEVLNSEAHEFVKSYHESCELVKQYFWSKVESEDPAMYNLFRLLLVPVSQFSVASCEADRVMRSLLDLPVLEQESFLEVVAASMSYLSSLNNGKYWFGEWNGSSYCFTVIPNYGA